MLARTAFIVAALCAATAVHADPKWSFQIGATYSVADTLWGFGGEPDTGTLGRTFKGTALRTSVGVAWDDRRDFEFGWSNMGATTRLSGFQVDGEVELRPVRREGDWQWVAWTPRFHRANWEYIGKIGPARVNIESFETEGTGAARLTSTKMVIGFAFMRHYSNGLGLRFDVDRLGSLAAARGISLSYRF